MHRSFASLKMTAYTYVANLRHTAIESPHAALATTRRMAGLRRVFDHPRLLADDSSLCRAVACAASFISSLALHCAVACVDGDVDRSRAGHVALARRPTLSRRLDLVRCLFYVCFATLYLFAIRADFHSEAIPTAS